MTKCFEKGASHKGFTNSALSVKTTKLYLTCMHTSWQRQHSLFSVKDPEYWPGQVLNPVASCLADQCSSNSADTQ